VSRYSISKEAIHDLDEISDYLGSRSIELGERFLKRFADRCKKLMNFPEMSRVYVEFDPNIRGLPLDSYVIFYRATKAEIEIIRVISGRQNLQALFSDDINY